MSVLSFSIAWVVYSSSGLQSEFVCVWFLAFDWMVPIACHIFLLSLVEETGWPCVFGSNCILDW